MKRALTVLLLLLVAVLLYLFLWPIGVDPVAWEPPAFDPSAWQPTGTVAAAERFAVPGHGPEDVELDREGRSFFGLDDGRIMVIDAAGKAPRTLADTGGRPLGLAWAKDGRLVVTDAEKGLLAVDQAGRIRVLTATCAGTRMVFTDDLDIAADGTVYFSDASSKYGRNEWKLDIVENRPNGRLCAWDPRTYQTREVLRDLYFANGVAIDPAQQFVLVNETSRYRVRRIWIDGDKKGKNDVFIENLPGFPDNLSTGSGGIFWIAIASPRNPLLDALAGSPFLRRAILRLPELLQPKPERTARALGVDASAHVRADLFDPNGEKVYMVTSVVERAGQLYFGSLQDSGFARMPRPETH